MPRNAAYSYYNLNSFYTIFNILYFKIYARWWFYEWFCSVRLLLMVSILKRKMQFITTALDTITEKASVSVIAL